MKLARDLRELPRAVWIVFAVTLVNRAGSMALMFLSLYVTIDLRASPGQASLLVGSYGAGAILAGPLAAVAMRTVRPTTVMAVALGVSGALLLVFPIVRGALGLVTLTCIWGATAEACRPASFTWIAEEVGAQHQKLAFAAARLGVNVGMSVGSALGGLLAERSFALVFVVDGATSLGLATSTYGLLWSGNAVAIILLELPLTSTLGGWSPARALATGALLLALGFGSFAAVQGVIGASFAVFVWTLGEMIFAPAAVAYAARAAPAGRRGLYMGIYNSVWTAALMLGPALGVVSLEHLGPARHWVSTALVGALAAALFGGAGRSPSRPMKAV